jgi:hypothetical protein
MLTHGPFEALPIALKSGKLLWSHVGRSPHMGKSLFNPLRHRFTDEKLLPSFRDRPLSGRCSTSPGHHPGQDHR